MLTLVRRYLRAFGPATVADVSQFTLLRRPIITAALDSAYDVVPRTVGGIEMLDVIDGSIDDEPAATARLLPMWDNLLLAYADRSRVVADAHRPHVIRRNGDVLASVLVDGRIVGVWRRVDDGIEICPFETIPAERWEALAKEARDLCGFLDTRETDPYTRYHHWWERLPEADRRTIVVE